LNAAGAPSVRGAPHSDKPKLRRRNFARTRTRSSSVGERERLVLAEVAAPPDVFDDIEAE